MSLLIYDDFRSRSRNVNKITIGIRMISESPLTSEDYFFHIPKRLDEKTINQRAHLCSLGYGMKEYKCDMCGWVYDPAVGEPGQGVAPGTAFVDLADDFECPVCGAEKGEFTEM